MDIGTVLNDALSLSSADRTQLIGILIRHSIECGEVEASTLRSTIKRIEEGQ